MQTNDPNIFLRHQPEKVPIIGHKDVMDLNAREIAHLLVQVAEKQRNIEIMHHASALTTACISLDALIAVGKTIVRAHVGESIPVQHVTPPESERPDNGDTQNTEGDQS